MREKSNSVFHLVRERKGVVHNEAAAHKNFAQMEKATPTERVKNHMRHKPYGHDYGSNKNEVTEEKQND